MARVLVVDDDEAVATMIADYLEARGHEVRTAGSGASARQVLEDGAADLVVVDVNMPGETGFSLARWLRESRDVGVLMLTGTDSTFDRVAGLEAGADDYLGKPFAPAELEARIQAILRRRRPPSAAGQAPLRPGWLPFGRYAFDPKGRRLFDPSGELIELSSMEVDLVAAFAARPGQVLTRNDLLDLAPPRGDLPFDRSIDSRISRLRQRLEMDPARPQLIKTLRGAGYIHPRTSEIVEP